MVATKQQVTVSPKELSLLRIAAADPQGSIVLHQMIARETARRLVHFGLGEMAYADDYGPDLFVINEQGRKLTN